MNLLNMICGRKMTEALIANGDAKQAEKNIEYQFKEAAWKYFKKNQNIYFSTFYGIGKEYITISKLDDEPFEYSLSDKEIPCTFVKPRLFYAKIHESELNAIDDVCMVQKRNSKLEHHWGEVRIVSRWLFESIVNELQYEKKE